MKLQKQLAYKYKGNPHYKYVLIFGEHLIKELDWEEGQELDFDIQDSRLILFKKV